MAWLPIAQTLPQYVDSNGDPYSGAVLKFYQDGTTTNINMATDDTGGTTVTSVALDSNGYPSNGGSEFIPHVEEKYKIALYPTQAAADSDTGAIWTIDNINPADLLDTDTDELAKVSSNDTTAGYLNGKLVAGTNVTLTEGSDGGNETLTIALTTDFQKGFFYGLTTGIDPVDTSHDVLINTGGCIDSTNTSVATLSSILTKQIDANWAEGDDAGGFPSALTLSNATWYHFFLIWKTDGTLDAGWDTDISASNLLSDASDYTYFRYLISHLTDGSANLTNYHQYHNWIQWESMVQDFNSTTATTESTVVLSVPIDIEVMAEITATLDYQGTATSTVIYTTDQAEPTPGLNYHTLRAPSGVANSSTFLIKTDTSAQIHHDSADAGENLDIYTRGWFYDRAQ